MSGTGTPVDRGTIQRIERFIDEKRVEHNVPGLSIAVTNPDEVVYRTAFGARDIEARIPVTPNTLYSIASVTKVYTALAILRLATTGQLSIDDEIRAYTDFWNDVPGDPITIAELLSHSTGVPEDHPEDRSLLFADELPASPLVTLEDTRIHANAAAERRLTDPDYFMYSSRGYEILGDIVGTVSGRPYEDFVEEELFAPMGMEDSQVGYGDLREMEGDVAHGYRFEEGEPVVSEHDLQREIHPPYSGGGILSSVAEMAQTARCLLNDGAIDGDRLIDTNLIDAMFRVQSPTVPAIEGATEAAVGYGPRVADFLGDTLAHHTGTAPGVSRAYMGVLRDSGFGVTLGVNTSDVPIGAVGQGVLALLKGETPAEVVPKLGLQAKCRAVAGTYEGFRGSSGITVVPDDSERHINLAFGDTDGPGTPALPNSTHPDDLTFYLQGQHGRRHPVSFHQTPDSLELRFNVYRLQRVP